MTEHVGEHGRGIALGPDPLRDHMCGVCEPGCAYCAKRRRIALEAVADAAWKMLDEGGEHPGDEGLHIVSSVDWQKAADALDALEASGWVSHIGGADQ